MKKLVLFVILSIIVSGCSSEFEKSEVSDDAETEVVESASENKKESEDVFFIDDKNFITYINYIYLNPDEYEGKIIEYEGFIDIQKNPNTNKEYCYCIRLGPGCCKNDSTVGFLLDIDGEFPLNKQWVRVKGYVQRDLDSKRIYVKVIDIKVLDEMGKVKVDH